MFTYDGGNRAHVCVSPIGMLLWFWRKTLWKHVSYYRIYIFHIVDVLLWKGVPFDHLLLMWECIMHSRETCCVTKLLVEMLFYGISGELTDVCLTMNLQQITFKFLEKILLCFLWVYMKICRGSWKIVYLCTWYAFNIVVILQTCSISFNCVHPWWFYNYNCILFYGSICDHLIAYCQYPV